jgi:multidrug efflux pump subunit AcrA (membrane-fusion protein)
MQESLCPSNGVQKSLWTRWGVISSLIGVFVAGLVIGLLLSTGGGPGEKIVSIAGSDSKVLFWTCSMHPQVKQGRPGRCPMCDMDLIPMREEGGVGEKASLRLGERARHLASVQTTTVEYRKLTKSIYTVGKIDYDESSVAHVTAWVSGRADKLYVDFTGTVVKKGEHLIYTYSPDLLSTQEEYLLAYNGIEHLRDSPVNEIVSSSRTLLENTKQRLLLWGITEEQIKELERTKKPQTHLTIHAPIGGTIISKDAFEGMYFKTGDMLFTIADLDRVWLYLDIYEYDLPWVRYGQDIEVITESSPGELFHGTVVFIDPYLNDTTRTIKVRINMDNREGKLKPGMYVNARIKAQLGSMGVIIDSEIIGKYICPMHPDVISDKEDNCPECGMKLELIGGRTGKFVPGLIQSRYECPMKCEGSTSEEVGSCPKCKMVLIEKEEDDDTQEEDSAYVCSEHIDYKTGFPGECPSCQRSIMASKENEAGVLAVPHSAVLFTGKRNIVYIEKGEGIYSMREVTLGAKADEYYPVLKGLNVGEKVVTDGNFLIDSQMQLLGKPSLLFPEGSSPDEPIAEKEEEYKESHNDQNKDEHKHTNLNTIKEQELESVTRDMLENYYDVAAELANDSMKGIDEGLEMIINNSIKLKDIKLDISEGLHGRLKEIAGNISDSATEMKGVEIETARSSFKKLSQSMINYLKELNGKLKGDGKTYVYYCPMVDATWLQKNEGTRNPYYGSSMLKCGSVKEELP